MCLGPTSSLGTYLFCTYLINGWVCVLYLPHHRVPMCFVPTSSLSTYVFCTYLITQYLCVLYLLHHWVPTYVLFTYLITEYLCVLHLLHHCVPTYVLFPASSMDTCILYLPHHWVRSLAPDLVSSPPCQQIQKPFLQIFCKNVSVFVSALHSILDDVNSVLS